MYSFFIYLYSFTGDTTISRRKSKETTYQTIFRWIQENPNQQSWNKGMWIYTEGGSSSSHNPIETVLSTTFEGPLKQAVAIELYWKDAI